MTVLGKVLVIVNLVFSLVTAALIIAAYSARTNWHAAYEKMNREFTVAQANARTYDERLQDAQRALGQAEKARQEALAQAAESTRKIQADLALVQQQLAQQQRNAAEADRNQRIAQAEASNLHDEVKKVQGLLKERESALVKALAEAKVQRDDKVQNEINWKTEQERNVALVDQVTKLSQEIERLKLGSTPGQALNPPQDNVEGTVRTVGADGYITLSIGSDAGLKAGNTLEVFRLQPEPKYLGMIRVINVAPHEAVARPMSGLRANAIQSGDKVAAHVTGG